MASRGKRKIEQLHPDDFPGVDTVAFAKWRSSAAKYEPLAWSVYIGILIVVPLVFVVWRPLPDAPVALKVPGFSLILFATLLGSVLLITREPRSLAKQAGITPEAIKAARKRARPISPSDAVGEVTSMPLGQESSADAAHAPLQPPTQPPASGSPYGARTIN